MQQTIIKSRLLAHLEMARPYTLCHAGLLAIAGAEMAAQGQIAAWRVGLAALVALCGWEAGLYAGDYYDRHLDAQSKPWRAIPSGRVSPGEARTVMIVLIITGYAAALGLGLINLCVAVTATVLGIAYSKTLKAHALFGNLDRGILGMCAVAFGAAASAHIAWLPLLLLLLMVFFHDAATNLVGTLRDMEGDGKAGYRTVPVAYGMGRAVQIVCGLALAGVCCGALALLLTKPGVPTFLFLMAVVLIDLAVYLPLAKAHAQVTRPQALTAHKLLVYERLALLSAFIALFTPLYSVLMIFVGAFVITAISQSRLRDRYERTASPIQVAS